MLRKRFTISIRSLLLVTASVAAVLSVAISLGFFSKHVVIAKDHFTSFKVLTVDDVEIKRLPFSFSLPDNAVNDLAEVVGKRSARRLAPGQIILLSDVTSEKGHLSTIYHNMRVVPVLIDNASDSYDSIKTGDLISLSKSGVEILSSVRVYAIDSQTSIFNLLISSEDSNKLTCVSNTKLNASLLKRKDEKAYQESKTKMSK